MKRFAFTTVAAFLSVSLCSAETPEVASLRHEVRDKGWIVFSARSDQGDYDLFVCRPDGNAHRNLTRTPEFNDAWPQWSHDGQQLLYRRVPRGETIDGNRYGEQGTPVLAKADGSEPEILGGEGDLPWASWGPDGKQVLCLSAKGFAIVDLASWRVLRTLPRSGFFQQPSWSPDGRWFLGVANSFGTSWSIARMNAESGAATAVNTVDCCTPDWFPDSRNVIFSWRVPGQKAANGNGWTQLWRANSDGTAAQFVYGEDGRHIYGGHVSPDGKYVLFTGNMEEDGDPSHAGAPMNLMRLSDAPLVGGTSEELHAKHPGARSGPLLDLPTGWEPDWTFAELPASPVVPQAAGTPPAANGASKTAASNAERLARDVHGLGWIAFSAKTETGDWDLFAMRPDGTERHKMTNARDFNEAGVRFSPDGHRLLYYRMPAATPIDNNSYGTHELVITDANGAWPTKGEARP